jgi:hypothetical protein
MKYDILSKILIYLINFCFKSNKLYSVHGTFVNI